MSKKRKAPITEANNSNKYNENEYYQQVMRIINGLALSEREISDKTNIDIKTVNYIIGNLRKGDLIFEGKKRFCTISVNYPRQVMTWTSNEEYAEAKPKFVMPSLFDVLKADREVKG